MDKLQKITIALFITGAVLGGGGLLYAFLAPSPVDVLIADYKDGYGYRGTHGTSTKIATTTDDSQHQEHETATATTTEEAPVEASETEVTEIDDAEETEANDEHPALRAVRTTLASELSIDADAITLEGIERQWSDGCLGLSKPDEMCTMAIVAGYEVIAEANGTTYTFRTNANGSVVREDK